MPVAAKVRILVLNSINHAVVSSNHVVFLNRPQTHFMNFNLNYIYELVCFRGDQEHRTLGWRKMIYFVPQLAFYSIKLLYKRSPSWVPYTEAYL